jgi:hypothetical protein
VRLFLLFFGLAGAGLAHWGQVRRDEVRWQSSGDERLGFLPPGETFQWLSMGFDIQIADWFWLKTVLLFGESDLDVGDPNLQDWLERSLNVSIHLDPEWRTLYSYGGLMLKVVEDIDASNRLLRRALERFPREHYFAFSLAANHFLQADQTTALELESGSEVALTAVLNGAGLLKVPVREAVCQGVRDRSSLLTAAFWMLHASGLEGAPDWYESAAYSFLTQNQSRKTAIRFLSEQLEREEDEKLIEGLTKQLNRYLHAYHSEAMTELVIPILGAVGKEDALDALLERGLMRHIPPDPYGEQWVVDVDSVVRSTWEVARVEQRALAEERRMLMDGGS